MKTKISLCLIIAVLLSGCSVMGWSDKDPDNRLRKSPCASLEVENVQRT